jgi:hypothetical protein
LDSGWEWGLTRNKAPECHRQCGLQIVALSNHVTSPSVSRWVMPLGKTPPYLDPQSQEAVYEVDVSGMPLSFSFDRHQSEQEESGPVVRNEDMP